MGKSRQSLRQMCPRDFPGGGTGNHRRRTSVHLWERCIVSVLASPKRECSPGKVRDNASPRIRSSEDRQGKTADSRVSGQRADSAIAPVAWGSAIESAMTHLATAGFERGRALFVWNGITHCENAIRPIQAQTLTRQDFRDTKGFLGGEVLSSP